MKFWKTLLLCVLVLSLLTACGTAEPPAPEEEETPQTEEETPSGETEAPQEEPEENTEPPAPEVDPAAARAAYAAVLRNLLHSQVLPDGTPSEPLEADNLAENRFAICDVDGDGREELVLLYTTASMAGHTGLVMDYDQTTDTLRTQLSEFPSLTFYDNGAIQADWSHNQGRGMDFWPYTVYVYRPETDDYARFGSVDAWDSGYAEEEAEAFPAVADTSGTGVIYYLMGDEATWDVPVDESVYRAWEKSWRGDAKKLDIPFAELTEEMIQEMTQG